MHSFMHVCQLQALCDLVLRCLSFFFFKGCYLHTKRQSVLPQPGGSGKRGRKTS